MYGMYPNTCARTVIILRSAKKINTRCSASWVSGIVSSLVRIRLTDRCHLFHLPITAIRGPIRFG
jgi:hypothetical protein